VALIDDDALVLDTHRYRDRHLIVALLTRDAGVVRGVLRRARVGKAPQAAAAQILSHVHVTGSSRRGADLATFRQLDLLTSSFPLARELVRSTASAVIAELLLTFCPLEEPAPRRYRLGVSLLDGLLEDVDPNSAVAYAQYWMLALSGVLPEPTDLDLDERDQRFLTACRNAPISDVSTGVTDRVAQWLDRRVRSEAHRPLRALDFLRGMTP